MPMNQRKMAAGVRLLLEGMGMDLNDRDFKDTPRRVAKMYRELFTPHRTRQREVAFPATYNEMIVLRHHTIHTVCPHHLMPVEMDVSVGYVPDKRVIGLSKLARVAESVLIKPLKQEEFTDSVAYKLYQICEPKGVAVRVAGRHGCMQHRGVKTRGDVVSQVLRGVFLLNSATRNEFLMCLREK